MSFIFQPSNLLGLGVDLLLSLLGTTTQAQDQVEGRLLLDVVVGEGATVLKLLAGEDQALLVRGNALLVLDLGLDIVDGVARLHLKGDGLAGELRESSENTTDKHEFASEASFRNAKPSQASERLQS